MRAARMKEDAMSLKRVTAAVIAAILVLTSLTAAGCAAKNGAGGPSAAPATDAPAAATAPVTDAPATEAPVESSAPATADATEALPSGVLITNRLGSAIETLYACSAGADDWGEPVLNGLDDEAACSLALESLTAAGEPCDILAVTEDGTGYIALDAELAEGDTLVLDAVNAEEMDIFFPCLTVNGSRYLDLYISPQGGGSAFEIYKTGNQITRYLGDEQEVLLVCTRWDELELSADCLSVYPRLDKQLTEDFGFDFTGRVINETDELTENMAEFYSEEPDLFMPSISNRRAYVRRADDAILSILIETSYEDGEGYVFFENRNYCPRSGRPLALTDVVKDISALPGLIAEQLEFRESAFEPDYGGDANAFFSDPDNTAYAWTLDPTGLTIFFNGGAFQLNSVLIPYADNEHIFAERYLDLPESYTLYFPPYVPTYMDLFGDGEVTEMRAGGEYFKDGSFFIEYNGIEFYPDGGDYAEDFWFVHANGRNYLYCATINDFEYCTINVFDLNGRRPSLVSVMETSLQMRSFMPAGEVESDGSVLMMIDPESFILGHDTKMPDRVYAYGRCRVGDDGMPTFTDGMFRYNEDLWMQYRLLADLELTLLSGGTVTVEAGGGENTIFLIGTNDVDKLLFLTAQGEAYLSVDYDPLTGDIGVGGVPLDEIIDPVAVG